MINLTSRIWTRRVNHVKYRWMTAQLSSITEIDWLCKQTIYTVLWRVALFYRAYVKSGNDIIPSHLCRANLSFSHLLYCTTIRILTLLSLCKKWQWCHSLPFASRKSDLSSSILYEGYLQNSPPPHHFMLAIRTTTTTSTTDILRQNQKVQSLVLGIETFTVYLLTVTAIWAVLSPFTTTSWKVVRWRRILQIYTVLQ